MKSVVWIIGAVAVVGGGYWLYTWYNSPAQVRLRGLTSTAGGIAGQNQAGGTSVFNEPNLEPSTLTADMLDLSLPAF